MTRLATLPKRADSNAGNDQSFESAFSNIAHAYLDDRAPGLSEYEVGFQLVDRNDDEFHPKALGILGFKAGTQWLYAPVFFINGALKGHELLYLKDQDKFVPLKENWINFLLSKKPASLGEGVDRNTRELGVHYPDMFRALQSPHKYAAARPRVAWAPGERAALAAEAAPLRAKLAAAGLAAPLADWAVIGLAATARHAGAPAAGLRLLDVVASGGVKAAADLHATLAAYPTLRAGFDAFYPAAAVKAAAAAVRVRPGGTCPRPRAKRAAARLALARTGSVLDHLDRSARARVEVHRFAGFGKAASVLLDGGDREALVRDGLLIKDARADDEVSHAYAVPTRIECESRFTTPNETGVYDLLVRDGGLEKCLIVVGPLGASGARPWATAIRLGGREKAWINAHPSHLYVAARYKEWSGWWEGLPEAKDLAQDGGPYVVLGGDGVATLPFSVVRGCGADSAGGEGYEVHFEDCCDLDRAGGLAGARPSPLENGGRDDDYRPWRDGERLHLGQKTGTRFRSSRGDVYAPAGCRLLRLRDDAGDDDGDGPEPPLTPASAVDVEARILRKYATLRILPRSSGYVVADEVTGNRTLGRDDAVVRLVAGHGLREAAARELLKHADAARAAGRAEYRCLVKHAAPYAGAGGQPGGRGAPYLTAGGPYAPATIDPTQGYDDVMGSAVPAMHPLEQSIRVDDLRADPRNRDAYDPANPDPMAAQVAQDASDKGQKEVFDTAMVANLLKMTRDDEMIDAHVPALMGALDHIGRLLFSFYWHTEKFSERFGQDDMGELEDFLRNNLENLGDLCLFIKQKSIDANPSESAQDIDLGDGTDQ